jgi:transcriptional regulator with XRE-family HTH domain
MEHRRNRNAVGTEIRKLRNARSMTQEMLVARCNLAGCNITRGTMAKIEAQIRGISDVELFTISRVFRVNMEELFPRGFAVTLKGFPGGRD